VLGIRGALSLVRTVEYLASLIE
jgi:hypothetical protein